MRSDKHCKLMFVVADATSLPRQRLLKHNDDKYDPRPIWGKNSHVPLFKFNKIKFREKERLSWENWLD